MFVSILQKILSLLVAFGLSVPDAAVATENINSHKVETGQYQQVEGINIYYGLMPAEIVARHPDTHEEKTMHHGLYAKQGDYHLIVALFDKNGQRITDASVTATIGEFGMAGIRKELEPMHVGEVRSFGNFFAMQRSGIYRIAIEVRRPAGAHGGKPVEALFDYRME